MPAPSSASSVGSSARARSTRATSRRQDNGRLDHVSHVYQQLRALIVSGQLPPGARIAERAVVVRMGLSRTPVRSALHRLQQEGFVASVGRAGDQRLIVTPLTQHDGRELFLIVGHLEGLAAREAASLPAVQRKQLVRHLRGINKTLAVECRQNRSPARVSALDEEFHRGYVEGVVGPRLRALHRSTKPQIERYVRLYVNVLLDTLPSSVKEHGVIIDAIARGNADAAQRAVETNWRNAADRLTRVIGEHGERGIWHLGLPDRAH
ncbi:MAG TPA: GntR family transcriptional regulator [Gemmatimonadaceae bacterium]|nr:GntR family transcriptional regulator [Gemmatimonadaceae bacterium]